MHIDQELPRWYNFRSGGGFFLVGGRFSQLANLENKQ